MAKMPIEDPAQSLSWFTPRRLLMIFCVINMINYVDRGAIASNGVNGSLGTCGDSGICTPGSGIQGDFNLNNFQDGVLSSAFMVGLLVACPIFAFLAKSHNPFRLIGVGLSVWTFAAAGCGSSFDFWSIAICRMLVGVGEASFISFAAAFIDDNAPAAQKTAWLATYYTCIPTGVAVGYVYGGLVGNTLNWRYAFFGEAFFMLPFAVLGFVMKPLQLKGFAPVEPTKDLTSIDIVACAIGGFAPVEPAKDLTSIDIVACAIGDSEVPSVNGYVVVEDEGFGAQASDKASKSRGAYKMLNPFSRFLRELKVLLLDKVYVVNVLGYTSYIFVTGAYSYWGPKTGYNIYHMNNADLLFGGITIVCGIFGTLSGGLILDYMSATISNAFKLLSGATLLGAIFCFSAFCFKSLYGFIALFSVGEILLFAAQAPVNYVCLHCVKPSMRPLSMAISTVSIHIFGDVPSSPLVGVLQDHVNNWRETSLILTSILFLAAGIWFIGIFLNSVDMFNEEGENKGSTVEKASTEPLLGGNRNKMLDDSVEA